MRVCLYTETALPKMGGKEMVVDALARHFLTAGHEVVVLAPTPRRPLRPDDRRLPYPVVRHPRFVSTWFLVSWYRRWLRRVHRGFRFDILHCHGIYPPGYLGALTRTELGVPLVITSHGGDLDMTSGRLAKAGLPLRHVHALRSADALVAISRFTRDGLARLWPHHPKVVTIPNGVDLPSRNTCTARPADLDEGIRPGRYALFLGRLKHRKGADLLLDALARVPAGLAVQIVVAGDGEERGPLEAQAARLGLTGRVRFVGQATGALKAYLLQNSLCTVVPSRQPEAFPLVVLESYASAVPVIAARVPGLMDLVLPGQTGLLVRPESAAALALALAQMFDRPARADAMGRQARQIAADHSWEAVARRHLELYAELLRNHPRRSAARNEERIDELRDTAPVAL